MCCYNNQAVANLHSWALILFKDDHQEIKNDCEESMKVAKQWRLMFSGSWEILGNSKIYTVLGFSRHKNN